MVSCSSELQKISMFFVTVDRNLAFQQNPSNLPLPVIVIHARSNKLKDLVHHVPALRQTLSPVLARQVYHIGTLRLIDRAG